jgi:hypothetical protein
MEFLRSGKRGIRSGAAPAASLQDTGNATAAAGGGLRAPRAAPSTCHGRWPSWHAAVRSRRARGRVAPGQGPIERIRLPLSATSKSGR